MFLAFQDPTQCLEYSGDFLLLGFLLDWIPEDPAGIFVWNFYKVSLVREGRE